MVTWDPTQYGRFGDERSRPFFDLVGRIAAAEPALVVDLGCGSGELTASLAHRWPGARVIGLDSSAEMLDAGRASAWADLVELQQADLRAWEPDGRVDVLVSNATLQWVPEHNDLLARFVDWLTPGGWLAFQVPGNFTASSHRLLAELRLSDRWRDLVGEGADRHLAVLDASGYADRLLDLGCVVDTWETEYVHVLRGPDPVVEWVKGTGLRPVLTILDPDDQTEFLASYAAALRGAYPTRSDGVTLFPFRRVFAVAQRPA
jgi:trans-aconitate 2-methyltransferase